MGIEVVWSGGAGWRWVMVPKYSFNKPSNNYLVLSCWLLSACRGILGIQFPLISWVLEAGHLASFCPFPTWLSNSALLILLSPLPIVHWVSIFQNFAGFFHYDLWSSSLCPHVLCFHYFFFFFFLFLFLFFQVYPQYMEVPGPGIEFKLQPQPTPQLQQCQILNPLHNGGNSSFSFSLERSQQKWTCILNLLYFSGKSVTCVSSTGISQLIKVS